MGYKYKRPRKYPEISCKKINTINAWCLHIFLRINVVYRVTVMNTASGICCLNGGGTTGPRIPLPSKPQGMVQYAGIFLVDP
jgi:hypothetical protein